MRRRSWAVGGSASCAFVVLAACGSSGSAAPDGGSPKVGTDAAVAVLSPADLKAFSYLTNSIPVEVTVAGATGWGIVDTGDPWALFDPTTFPAVASLPDTGGTVSSVTLTGETVDTPWVYGSTTGDIEVTPAFEIDANVGFTVVGTFVASFNYRDVTFTLGDAASPSGLEAATSVPFSLAGGQPADGDGVYPASRVVVTVSVEGKDYAMIVDTGATDVTLSATAYSALTADGRVQISGDVETTTGSSTSSLTRAAKVTVGGVEVDGIVVAHDSSFDDHLASVSMDAGKTIDGSLGGTFLRDFYVSVDYPNRTLSFARYSDTSFLLDQAELIGITLGIDETNDYVVNAATGDAAKKGVAVGDVILAIDGTTLASVSEIQVEALLYGMVGSTRLVKFGTAATLSNMTVPILVDETLPLPAGAAG